MDFNSFCSAWRRLASFSVLFKSARRVRTARASAERSLQASSDSTLHSLGLHVLPRTILAQDSEHFGGRSEEPRRGGRISDGAREWSGDGKECASSQAVPCFLSFHSSTYSPSIPLARAFQDL